MKLMIDLEPTAYNDYAQKPEITLTLKRYSNSAVTVTIQGTHAGMEKFAEITVPISELQLALNAIPMRMSWISR